MKKYIFIVFLFISSIFYGDFTAFRLASNGYIDGPGSINKNNINRSYDSEILYYYEYFLDLHDNPLYVDNVEDKAFQEKLLIKEQLEFYFDEGKAISSIYNYIFNSIKLFDGNLLYKKIPLRDSHTNLQFNPEIKNAESWIKSERRKILINKLKKFFSIKNLFFWRQWNLFKLFTPDIINYYDFDDENQLNRYIEELVDLSYYYTNSNLIYLSRVHNTNHIYKNVVIKNVTPEMILSIFMRETKLWPFAFRLEKKLDYYGETRYAKISLGLGQVLVDADRLNLGENAYELGIGAYESNYLGNKIKYSRYDFQMIKDIYFQDENFIDRDLLTLRGAILYTAVYLEVLLNRAKITLSE